jgi:hypothetical protein
MRRNRRGVTAVTSNGRCSPGFPTTLPSRASCPHPRAAGRALEGRYVGGGSASSPATTSTASMGGSGLLSSGCTASSATVTGMCCGTCSTRRRAGRRWRAVSHTQRVRGRCRVPLRPVGRLPPVPARPQGRHAPSGVLQLQEQPVAPCAGHASPAALLRRVRDGQPLAHRQQRETVAA